MKERIRFISQVGKNQCHLVIEVDDFKGRCSIENNKKVCIERTDGQVLPRLSYSNWRETFKFRSDGYNCYVEFKKKQKNILYDSSHIENSQEKAVLTIKGSDL